MQFLWSKKGFSYFVSFFFFFFLKKNSALTGIIIYLFLNFRRDDNEVTDLYGGWRGGRTWATWIVERKRC